MNAKFYVFIFAVMLSFFIAAPQKVQCQNYFDSCVVLIWADEPDKGYYNPDSMMYDSCICKDKRLLWRDYDPCSKTHYVRQWFWITMPRHALDIPEMHPDSIVERNWTDIDKSFVELRNGFENLENIFGSFVLRKKYPDCVDTTSYASLAFLIRFQNYIRIDSAKKLLDSISDLINVHYWFRIGSDTYNYDDFENPEKEIEIFNYPENNFIILRFSGVQKIISCCEIYDINGRLWKRLDIPIGNEEQTIQIDLHGFCQGIYFLRLNNQIQLFQVIK